MQCYIGGDAGPTKKYTWEEVEKKPDIKSIG